jgi:hypothetical protein
VSRARNGRSKWLRVPGFPRSSHDGRRPQGSQRQPCPSPNIIATVDFPNPAGPRINNACHARYKGVDIAVTGTAYYG